MSLSAQPFAMPIFMLGSLQYFADVRRANAIIDSSSAPPHAEARSMPAGFSSAPKPRPAGVSALEGEGDHERS